MVSAAPEFNRTPPVNNGYSDLLLEPYGPGVGMHARSSSGRMLRLNAPVDCGAEAEIDGHLGDRPERLTQVISATR